MLVDTGFGMIIEFVRYSIFITKNNYKIFTVLHNIQITIANSKSSLFAVSSHVHCLVAASNKGDSLYCFRAQQMLSLLAAN